MKRIIKINEGDLDYIVTSVISEAYFKRKPIPQYSDNDKLELIKDPNIVNGGNFGIKRNGVEYWVSRSNTISLYVYCKDVMGNWCILASQRGPKAKWSGKWNVICGFLDYGYSLEQTAVKECEEETGIKINIKQLHNIGTNSSRTRDAVNTCFYTILSGTIDNYPTNISGCEDGEVSQAGWIRVDELGSYPFAGKQAQHAVSIIQEYGADGETHNKAILKRTIKQMVDDNEINVAQYNNILNIIYNG